MLDFEVLQPTHITKNLKGKSFLFYGLPKVGKTTLLSKFPKCLILSFEPGTNALDNVYVQPIPRWAVMKDALKELRKDSIKEKFDFIGIDTGDIAWELCEKHICMTNGVSELADIPWGKGYALCKKEFSDTFREIATLGYGICFISHSTEKTMKDEKGNEYVTLAPALPTRPYDIINKMVDTIGYIRAVRNPETGENKTFLFLRGDDRFVAGSRFKYLEPRIELSYNALVNAISDAIEKQAAESGRKPLNIVENNFENVPMEDFPTLQSEAQRLWNEKIVTTKNEEYAKKILDILQKYCGKPTKLSEITESQKAILEVVIEEMKLLA